MTKIFVGGLSLETNQESLKAYFNNYGNVAHCKIVMDNKTGKSRGFGFVTFSDGFSVTKVMASNNHELDGFKIDPKPFQNTEEIEKEASLKIFVGDLYPEVPEDTIRNYFSQFGDLEAIHLPIDKISKKRSSYGFIKFTSVEAAKKAVARPNHVLGQCRVDVKQWTARQQEQEDKDKAAAAGGGGPRGGGRGGFLAGAASGGGRGFHAAGGARGGRGFMAAGGDVRTKFSRPADYNAGYEDAYEEMNWQDSGNIWEDDEWRGGCPVHDIPRPRCTCGRGRFGPGGPRGRGGFAGPPPSRFGGGRVPQPVPPPPPMVTNQLGQGNNDSNMSSQQQNYSGGNSGVSSGGKAYGKYGTPIGNDMNQQQQVTGSAVGSTSLYGSSTTFVPQATNTQGGSSTGYGRVGSNTSMTTQQGNNGTGYGNMSTGNQGYYAGNDQSGFNKNSMNNQGNGSNFGTQQPSRFHPYQGMN